MPRIKTAGERVSMWELFEYDCLAFKANAIIVGSGADAFSDYTVGAFPYGCLDSGIQNVYHPGLDSKHLEATRNGAMHNVLHWVSPVTAASTLRPSIYLLEL